LVWPFLVEMSSEAIEQQLQALDVAAGRG